MMPVSGLRHCRSAGRSDSGIPEPQVRSAHQLRLRLNSCRVRISGSTYRHHSTSVMLCEMFCGKLPFTSSNTMELIAHHHLQQPPIRSPQ